MALLSSQLSRPVERRYPDSRGSCKNFRAPTSHLEFTHQGYLHPTSPSPAGYRQAPPPDDKSQSDLQRLPHPRSHRRGWGWGGWGEGGSQRKLPAAPSRAMRSGRDTAASAPGETAAVLPQLRLEGALGTRRGEASSGPGAQAEGRGRAQEDASPRLAPSQEYSNISQSMNLPPWLSWNLVSATDPLTIP